jgi:hypothetical protein
VLYKWKDKEYNISLMGKKRHELWAEAIRDVGILLLVFGPLDTLFRAGRGTSLDWLIALGVALLGLLLIAIGIKIEAEP